MIAEATPPVSATPDPRLGRLLEDLRIKCGLRRDELLERKVAGVLRQVPAEEREAWAADLEGRSPQDPRWLRFVEAITVHETYFFRDPVQLDALVGRILPAMIAERARHGRRRLKLWSAGCASGEEAYTVAILVLQALAQAGEAPERWQLHVLGTDISRTVIAHAREAVYGGPGLNAFRRLPTRYESCFVEAVPCKPERRRVRPDIARLVAFRQHNLMDRDGPDAGFDLVLCRNVFIYFDDEGQGRAVRMLRHATVEGGYLLLGVTDRLAHDSGFERCQVGTAVVYRREKAAG